MNDELKDREPYMLALAREVYRRASENFALGNFCDPGQVAMAVLDHHLKQQADPRLKSDNPVEALKARNEVRDQEQKARAVDSHYVAKLMREADLTQALSPVRIRRYGQSRTRNLLYLQVPAGKMTQAELDERCDCVGEKMAQFYSGRSFRGDIGDIDRNFMEFLQHCQSSTQTKALTSKSSSQSGAEATVDTRGKSGLEQTNQQPNQAKETTNVENEVNSRVEKASKALRGLRDIFKHP